MPEPKSNEKQSEFISRCVPVVMNEGNTKDQVLGKCYGIWRQNKKKSLMTATKELLCKLKNK